MATEYNYDTCQLTRDFHFVRYGEACRLGGLPTYTGRGFCKRCKYNAGEISPIKMGLQYAGEFEGCYVKCKHPEKNDSENTSDVQGAYYDYIRERALCALCN